MDDANVSDAMWYICDENARAACYDMDPNNEATHWAIARLAAEYKEQLEGDLLLQRCAEELLSKRKEFNPGDIPTLPTKDELVRAAMEAKNQFWYDDYSILPLHDHYSTELCNEIERHPNDLKIVAYIMGDTFGDKMLNLAEDISPRHNIAETDVMARAWEKEHVKMDENYDNDYDPELYPTMAQK